MLKIKDDVDLDEEKKVIEHLKIVAKERTIIPLCDNIKTVLNLIEKKDKIINEMAKYIDDTQMECNVYYKDKEEVIEYFEEKVSNKNGNA